MKYFKLFENYNKITTYHRSKEHIRDLDVNKVENNGEQLFGQAIYLSSSSSISPNFGMFVGKYEIVLDNPLNLNKIISFEYANKLYKEFNKRYNVGLDDFDFETEYDDVQIGEVFEKISDETIWDSNVYFYDFIKNYMRFNSFYHYCNYHTDFITEEGDYGYCYGIYNNSDIKFISEYS